MWLFLIGISVFIIFCFEGMKDHIVHVNEDWMEKSNDHCGTKLIRESEAGDE